MSVRIKLFANGDEASVWMGKNCDRCTKDDGCPIQVPIIRAYVSDGTATVDEAAALGLPSIDTGTDRCPSFDDNGRRGDERWYVVEVSS